MGCKEKIKNTCGEKLYATCTYYELEVPSFSGLINEECYTLEETTEDLYNLIEEIKEDTELSELGESCLEYVVGSEKNTVKKVLLKYEEEICTLKEKVKTLEETAICDKNITECVDVSGLEDACSDPILSLGQLLTYLVTKVNE